MKAFKYITTIIITLNIITTSVIAVVMVIPEGALISQTSALIMLINWREKL